MAMCRSIVLLACFMFLYSGNALAQSPPPFAAGTASRIDSLRRTDPVLAVAVAVVRGDSIVWEAGFGGADAHSVFRVASVAKSITAVAAMMLAQEGRLDLDAPISRYLRGPIPQPEGSAPLTSRHLLMMTGGVPHTVRFNWADGPARLGEEGMLRRYGFVAFPPGQRFHYSNMSFGVLQSVISGASGQSYERYMDQVFRRAGMTDTRLEPRGSDLPGYLGSSRLAPGGLEPDGGAGFRSSARDLARLAAALLGRRLLDSASLAAMWNFERQAWYGLGWWRDVGRVTETIVLADGAGAGGSATIMLDTRRRMAAIVLLNRGSDVAPSLAGDLLAAAARDMGDPLPASQPPVPPALFVERPFDATAEWQGDWCGTIMVDSSRVPVVIRIHPGRVPEVALAGGASVAGTNATVAEGLLSTTFPAMLESGEPAGQPHVVRLRVMLHGSSLVGYVMAQSTGPRPLFMLPYAVTLTRAAGACQP